MLFIILHVATLSLGQSRWDNEDTLLFFHPNLPVLLITTSNTFTIPQNE
jgi:hypothetical protein